MLRQTFRSSPLTHRCTASWATAAAVAAVATLTSTSAGGVIYSGPVDLVIPVDSEGRYLNLETGVSTTGGGFAGCDFNAYGGDEYLNLWSAPSWGTGYRDLAGGAPSGYTNLQPGAVIGGAGQYFGTTAGTYPFGTDTNQWKLNSTGIVGLRFIASDNLTHYGWVAIAFGATAADRRIVGYAYESVAGASIVAGAIPAPGTIALLGAAGLVGRRRRS